MGARSQLQSALSAAEGQEQYDRQVKALLSFKVILAEILKGCLREYAHVPREEVVGLIEGAPEVGVHPLHSGGEAEMRISGSSNEDATLAEGTVTYDIRFLAALPDGGGRAQMIVNVEAQKESSPGYPLLKRAVYYAGRLLSAQHGTVFAKSHYELVQKVATVWVCPDPPRQNACSVRSYRLAETVLAGGARARAEDYDLIEVVFVELGEGAARSRNRLVGLLGTLLSMETPAREKLETLGRQYGIRDPGMDEEVMNMGGLGQILVEKSEARGRAEGRAVGRAEGEARGRAEGLRVLVTELGLSAKDALDRMRVPEDRREEVARLAGVAL